MNEGPHAPENITADDPRLTAFALGETSGEDHARLAAAIAADPQLRAAVDNIRDTAGLLAAALEAEVEVETESNSAVESAIEPPIPFTRDESEKHVARSRLWWLASGVAAACAALALLVPRYAGLQTGPAPAASPPSVSAVQLQAGSANSSETDSASALGADADPPGTYSTLVVPEVFKNPIAENPLPSPPDLGAEAEKLSLPAPLAPTRDALLPTRIGSAPPITPPASTAAIGALAGLKPSRSLAASYFPGTSPDANLYNITFSSSALRGLPPAEAFNREAYDRIVDSGFLAVSTNPLSTFSVDVDTASYSNIRRFLVQMGELPPPDAVRIEEILNSFTYDYAPPSAETPDPFAVHIDTVSAPWKTEHQLVRIGLKAREVSTDQRPAANLVFLLDVSGSMRAENKLPLVKESMRLLVSELRPDDRVAIAVYAGASGLVLPSTEAREKHAILNAIDRLEAGGSTNGAMGIQLAYELARANFLEGGINRIILATDGDFNLGVTDRGQLERLIEERAKSGVFLTVLGFGMGNIQDATLEQLADHGNGAYAYIDNEREARRVMVEQATGTLLTVAKDVKIQVEFNPVQIQAYRLIGYENRALAKEDFNNDAIDAGEIGAGHAVTALYEVVPAGAAWSPVSTTDPLKYQRTAHAAAELARRSHSDDPAMSEWLTVKLRYKEPHGDESRRLEFPFTGGDADFQSGSTDMKFAAALAAFGMLLRDSPYKGTISWNDVLAWAAQGIGIDAGGRRKEFIDLIRLAQKLEGE